MVWTPDFDRLAEGEVACPECEGDGSYSKLADCTTGGPDCACNGPRVTVDPCPRCKGSGAIRDSQVQGDPS